MRRVERRVGSEAEEVEHWSRAEVTKLIEIAHTHEPRFGPLLALLFSTGLRRGEALGLQWRDLDFEGPRITVRRSITLAGLTTPKSGKLRRVAMPPGLASQLLDVLGERRREALARGWPDVPEWVFCSQTGTAPDPSNINRVWQRVRRRAQKKGIRPLKLHCARHTWATAALGAGKSIRWVADQLGHSDPALTLRVYAHAMREEETDLSFVDFGGSERLYPAPTSESVSGDRRNLAERTARREGFEPPTLRFEA